MLPARKDVKDFCKAFEDNSGFRGQKETWKELQEVLRKYFLLRALPV